jgi:transcriptional regulator with XRE-family HTH domain
VAIRSRAIDEARRLWSRTELEIGELLRSARRIAALTQQQLGIAIGVSPSEVSRRELGHSRRLTGERLAIHAAAVGLKLSVRLFPIGGALRDEAQARYIAALVARMGRAWKVILEAPIPSAGDLRAIDILLVSGTVRIAVEVITRLTDLQAQIRAAQQKARDVGATRLVLAIASTHANRRALAGVRSVLVPSFELDTRRVLSDLAAGRDPGRDAIILVSTDPLSG